MPLPWKLKAGKALATGPKKINSAHSDDTVSFHSLKGIIQADIYFQDMFFVKEKRGLKVYTCKPGSFMSALLEGFIARLNCQEIKYSLGLTSVTLAFQLLLHQTLPRT